MGLILQKAAGKGHIVWMNVSETVVCKNGGNRNKKLVVSNSFYVVLCSILAPVLNFIQIRTFYIVSLDPKLQNNLLVLDSFKVPSRPEKHPTFANVG